MAPPASSHKNFASAKYSSSEAQLKHRILGHRKKPPELPLPSSPSGTAPQTFFCCSVANQKVFNSESIETDTLSLIELDNSLSLTLKLPSSIESYEKLHAEDEEEEETKPVTAAASTIETGASAAKATKRQRRISFSLQNQFVSDAFPQIQQKNSQQQNDNCSPFICRPNLNNNESESGHIEFISKLRKLRLEVFHIGIPLYFLFPQSSIYEIFVTVEFFRGETCMKIYEL